MDVGSAIIVFILEWYTPLCVNTKLCTHECKHCDECYEKAKKSMDSHTVHESEPTEAVESHSIVIGVLYTSFDPCYPPRYPPLPHVR